MLNQDHLTLRLIRLSADDQWVQNPEGLTFLLQKAGGASYTSKGKPLSLAPGDVLVANDHALGNVAATQSGNAVFWTFTVTVEHLFPLFAANEIGFLQKLGDIFKCPKLYSRSLAVAVECHNLVEQAPSRFNVDHRSHLVRVASSVLSLELSNARAQHSGFVRIEEHITQVFESLSTTEILNLSVGELADRFGCSRRHLNRLFHQYFGLSVAGLRMEMRLLKAVSLLRDRDAKVINIAEECGFRHLGLFNTCFKRRFGVNPGQWRKQPTTPQRPPNSVAGDPHCQLRANGLCPWSDGSGPTGPVRAVPIGDSMSPCQGLNGSARTCALPAAMAKPNGANSKPLRQTPLALTERCRIGAVPRDIEPTE